jgi:hypothetical protein
VIFDPVLIYRHLTEDGQARRRKGVLANQLSMFETDSPVENPFNPLALINGNSGVRNDALALAV